MAFENVDVSRLKSSINECKSSIDYSRTEELISNISNDNVWCTKSRNKLKERLLGLINTEYSDLKKILNTYDEASNLILQYKNLEADNNEYRLEIKNLKTEIDQSKSTIYTVSSGDSLYAIATSHGTSVAEIVEANNIENANIIYAGQQLIIPNGSNVNGLLNEITSLQNKISENINQMNSIENRVKSMI